ncbi:trichoplein keratin filament-binding protein [Anoplophora glabripennis]|uniref:trichoplein keratin filament-binding protein n=1 Tax=Anoplophora glabripennis TaxID=217634 RepID=UPI0008751494|nr:trichoplein keratin filament-binding protein [Anoplophora glabripennis]
MYRSGEMERPKERGKHRLRVENEMIRRREREFSHQQMWGSAEKYYKHWEKANTKFDEWTSPRYYKDNNRLMSEITQKREKGERLEKRREKLRQLLQEEQSSFEIELMVYKNKSLVDRSPRIKPEDIPTDVLKEINTGIRLKEEERRRHEAETKLYHQWRKNNPIVRQYESKYRCKDIKLSWLDQQIEKRMQKEKEEEEAKRTLRERDERIRKEKEKEERFKRHLEERREQLKADLEKQVRELKGKQALSEGLRKLDDKEGKRKAELAEIVEKQAQEERRRKERECALYNLKQHKLKLKQKAADVQENLVAEKALITKLKALELEDIFQDELKKREIREGLDQFLEIVKEQQELERQRRRHLEFLFDSEARAIYEKQTEMWKREELARQQLVKEVIETIGRQVEDNLGRNKEKQRQIILEREEMARKIEECNGELDKLKVEEEARKAGTRKMIEEDVKVKNARKKQQENIKLREIDEELERIRKEEERLQREILRIQQRQGPYRPPRSRLFF